MKAILRMRRCLTVGTIALVLASCAGTSRDLASRLRADDIASQVTVEHYYGSGLGMDHHYLWELGALDESAFDRFIKAVGARQLEKRSSSGCMGLDQDKAPDWWPANQLEDALWDHTKSPFRLYRKSFGEFEVSCIFYDPRRRKTYVQLFTM